MCVNNFQTAQKKDIYDKLKIIISLLSFLSIAIASFVFTIPFNKRQQEVNERMKDKELFQQKLSIIESFFDDLSSKNPEIQKSALDAVLVLGDTNLTIKLAENFAGIGCEEFLKSEVLNTNKSLSIKAGEALTNVQSKRKKKLNKEISYRLQHLNNFVTSDTSVSKRALALSLYITDETPPGGFDSSKDNELYFYEDFSKKNLFDLFDDLESLVAGSEEELIEDIEDIGDFEDRVVKFNDYLKGLPINNIDIDKKYKIDETLVLKKEYIHNIREEIDYILNKSR